MVQESGAMGCPGDAASRLSKGEWRHRRLYPRQRLGLASCRADPELMKRRFFFKQALKRISIWLCLLSGLVSAGSSAQTTGWQPIGISGGGGMFTPAVSPVDPNLMMLNCDMSAAYLSEDGGRNWRMIHHAQLRSDTACRPAFHPTDPNIIYASSGGRLKISRDRGMTFNSIGNLKEGPGGRDCGQFVGPKGHFGRARAPAIAGSRAMRE